MGIFSAQASSSGERLLITGRIVPMTYPNEIYENGAICIEKDRIVAVVSDIEFVPEEFESISPIKTEGTIYPGLIDMHNHLSYNFLPLWSVPNQYTNRNQWRTEEPDYHISITSPAKILGKNVDKDYPRSIARFVECRSLLGGTTTTQGLSSSLRGESRTWYKGLTRNVEAPNEPIFPKAGGKTLDYRASEIESKLVPALKRDNPFFYHLSEGTDDDARQRFLDLEYKKDVWAVDQDLIAIHCTGLQGDDFKILARGGGMVWSPLSNFLLYGRTADIVSAKKSGIKIALGTDWSPSGSKNLLGELKIAQIVSKNNGGVFSLEELVRMVTSTPAEILGWEGQVGALKRGMKADLLILEGNSIDPFEQLVAANEDDILAVVIDGRPRHGRMNLLDFDKDNQEQIVIGGKNYCLDLTESGNDPLGGLTLTSAIDKLTYGLANLPDLVTNMPKHGTFAFEILARDNISIDFDFDDADDFRTMQNKLLSEVRNLRPIKMSPITAIDDHEYIPFLRTNINLPDYVKEGL